MGKQLNPRRTFVGYVQHPVALMDVLLQYIEINCGIRPVGRAGGAHCSPPSAATIDASLRALS
jgi:hypothetical protein